MGKFISSDEVQRDFSTIPNAILDALAGGELNPYETKLFARIVRNTYGWQADFDEISVSQFMGKGQSEGDIMSKPTVLKSLASLEEKGYILSAIVLVNKVQKKFYFVNTKESVRMIAVIESGVLNYHDLKAYRYHQVKGGKGVVNLVYPPVNEVYQGVVNDVDRGSQSPLPGGSIRLTGVVNDVDPQKERLNNSLNNNIKTKQSSSAAPARMREGNSGQQPKTSKPSAAVEPIPPLNSDLDEEIFPQGHPHVPDAATPQIPPNHSADPAMQRVIGWFEKYCNVVVGPRDQANLKDLAELWPPDIVEALFWDLNRSKGYTNFTTQLPASILRNWYKAGGGSNVRAEGQKLIGKMQMDAQVRAELLKEKQDIIAATALAVTSNGKSAVKWAMLTRDQIDKIYVRTDLRLTKKREKRYMECNLNMAVFLQKHYPKHVLLHHPESVISQQIKRGNAA